MSQTSWLECLTYIYMTCVYIYVYHYENFANRIFVFIQALPETYEAFYIPLQKRCTCY